MKKNFCKVLAMAIVAIMMMSVSVFAAIEEPAVADEVVTVTISGLNTGEEATILVVDADKDIATLTNSDIIYIDQITVADGKATFTFDASAATAADDGSKVVDIYSGYTSMTGDAALYENVTVCAATVSNVLYGDADLNKEIGLNDAIVTLGIYTGSVAEPSSDQIVAADVDGTEGVGLNDAIMILGKYTGSYTDSFPVEK